MKFSDGMEFDTSGDYRIESRSDGLYVVGHNMLCPVDTQQEANDLIVELSASEEIHIVVMECDEDDTPNYMTEDGWCADINEAQRMKLIDARVAAQAQAELDENWYIWIGRAPENAVQAVWLEVIKEYQ